MAEFFDGALPARLAADRVPGAVVSVAAGGATAFAQGYGSADTERAVPFDASRSLVRIASISKLFTWTAVMQQVQAGRLDLDTDVNRYLTDLQVPDTYPQPVTLRHLMSHTAGFEDFITGTGARRAEDVPPLGRYLADHLPDRIRPPGEISAYSNFGAALAGHIVSEVSGEPYDRYVQRHLLDPLRMTRSTAAEPVPAALAPDLARSYDTDVNPPKVYPFTFDQMPPDGSVTTTAVDMAEFMNAHLGHGPGRILAAPTMARMHERSFTADPRIDGYAHGFKERTVNGHRVLMHDGGWEGFTSLLMLLPDCDLGLFMSLNSLTGGTAEMLKLVDAFFDRFAPGPAGTGTGQPADAGGVPRAGFYKPTRHNASTFEKLTTLLSPSRLAVDDAGVVTFRGKTWTRQDDGRYQADDGDRLVFPTGTRYVATDGSAAELMSPAETIPVNLGVLSVLLLPVLAALVLPIGALVRRIRRRPVTTTRTWRIARRLAVGAGVLGVVFLAGLMITLLALSGEFLYGVPLSFRLLLGLPVVALAVAVIATGLTVRSWRGSGAGVAARIHQVALLAGMVALTWFLWQWNLLGWQGA
ncbi:serine hydrolase [Actinoplanes sichuanensis]|nr:serine hydrolase [Actinoplanes sichuanensis]